MSFLMRIHKCPHVEIFNMLCSLFKYYLHVSMVINNKIQSMAVVIDLL